MSANMESAANRLGGEGQLKDLFVGALSVFTGLRMLFGRQELRSLAVAPLVLTLIAYFLVGGVGFYFSPEILESLVPKPDVAWKVVAWWLVVVGAAVGLAFASLLLFGTVAELIGGPFYDKMALRVLRAHHVQVHEPGFFASTFPDLVRSLLFLLPALFLAVLGLIPVIGVVFAVAGAIMAWLGFAAAAINPALMVTGHAMKERVRFVFANLPLMLGMGAVVGASLAIPLIGLVSIPASVIGASELYGKALERQAKGAILDKAM